MENETLLFLLFFFIIIIIIYAPLARLKKSNLNKNHKNNDIEDLDEKTINSSFPFKKVYLLTKNEWAFYKQLKLIVDKYNLSIIAKVRLADLVEVDTTKTINFQEHFNKIKSKHIDFAIVKSDNMEVKYLIELDDTSHKFSDRIKRDLFIDKLFEVTGYKLIRTYGNTDEIENILMSECYMYKKDVVF